MADSTEPRIRQAASQPRLDLGTADWTRFLPSLAVFAFAIAFVLALAMRARFPFSDGDLGRHLALGDFILEQGRFPLVDVFSHTLEGSVLVPHEWLAQVVLAAAHRLGGFDLVALVFAGVIALAWAITGRLVESRGYPLAIALPLLLLGMLASAIHWFARAHIFTFLFVVITIALLEDFRTARRSHVWWLPLVMIIWANTHGGFVVGWLLILLFGLTIVIEEIRKGGLWIARPRIRHLAFVLALSVVATFINPMGVQLPVHVLEFLSDRSLLGFTQETNSPNFHAWPTWPFLLMLLIGLALPLRRQLAHVIITGFWIALSLYSVRNIPLFALVATPYYIDAAASIPWNRRLLATRRSIQGSLVATTAVLLALLGISIFVISQGDRSIYDFDADIFPVAAMASVDDPPGDHVFNQFQWGGYLLQCCWPEIRVFLDGQTDHYGFELNRDYLRIISAEPEWPNLLARFDVDWVLISPRQPLAVALSDSGDWDEIYRDQTAVIFVRIENL